MSNGLRSLLLRLLRVPARPQPPAGDTGRVLTFRASPRYFQYRVAIWALQQLIALTALIGGALFLHTVASSNSSFARFTGWGVLELYAYAAFLVQLPVSFMVVRLDFEMRWYLLADRSLRIREGTLVVREKTMTYANIQNISIRRNPLQRIFGLATVAVRAAGGGSGAMEQKGAGAGGHTHEALFDGVDNADEIREILRERIRRHRDSGLGDPDDVQDGDGTSAVLIAARELLEEARLLRAASV
jgi:membrane protein YdbS with pleckstrin-like domain